MAAWFCALRALIFLPEVQAHITLSGESAADNLIHANGRGAGKRLPQLPYGECGVWDSTHAGEGAARLLTAITLKAPALAAGLLPLTASLTALVVIPIAALVAVLPMTSSALPAVLAPSAT